MGVILYLFRAFNTVANVLLAGQIAWWFYKKSREWHKQRLNAQQLRDAFIEEYRKKHGEKPSEELISVALRSYNAVERPILEELKRAIGL